ncbi:MAG: UvrB/UvrC motif-containing protein [Cloacibacillus sp.]
MLCEQCGVKEAEIHLVNVVNGERHFSHLCRECAGTKLRLDDVSNIIKMSFSLDGLSNIEEAFKELVMPALRGIEVTKKKRHICPHCGSVLPASMFADKEADDLFDEMSAEDVRHISERAAPISAEEEMAELSKKMAEAVKKEEYEAAAKFRDRILELKHSAAPQEKRN